MMKFGALGRRFVWAILILLIGVAGFGAYEACWLGRVSLSVPLPEAAALSPAPECRVAVLRSGYTSGFFKSPKEYEAHIDYWRTLLRKIGVPSEVVDDARLEEGLQGFQILLLPSAICLSDKERASIRSFVGNGGGSICTWATGARNESGAWKGLDFLLELTGADSFEFTQRTPPWYVSFVYGRPTAAGVPAGFRVQVDAPERLEAKSFDVDAYWSDARFVPVSAQLPVNFQGSVLHNTFGRGRVVWYGFHENTAVAGGNDKALLDAALANGVAWAGQQTLGAINPWPSPYLAATVFACDVEEDVDNAAYAASTLRKAQATGTFFWISNLLKKNPDLVRQLKSAGEVESHEGPADGLNSEGYLAQAIRMEASKWALWRASGGEAKGFHSPAGAFSDATWRALAVAHLRYLLTSGEGGAVPNSVLPEIHLVSQSLGWFHHDAALVRLTRTFEDDLHYSPLGIVGLDPAWITRRAMADFEIIRELGGLYVFNFHSQGFSSPEYVGVIASLIDESRRSATWIATASEVADWWELKSHLSVGISEKKADGMRLTVKYDGTKPLDHVALSIFPPRDALSAHIEAAEASRAAADVAPGNGSGCLTVRLGRLAPGSTNQYDLRWTK